MASQSIAYVDALNLYYRALRNTPYRWIDVVKMCDWLSNGTPPHIVRFFWAKVLDPPWDLSASHRQNVLIEALRTSPRFHDVPGQFRLDQRSRMLVNPPPGGPLSAKVWIAEEKGSDVNLATWLVADAAAGRFDVAFVVTNDSDLCEPIRMVKDEFGKDVVLLSPDGRSTSAALRAVATSVRQIRPKLLAKCQLNDPITKADGTKLYKPSTW